MGPGLRAICTRQVNVVPGGGFVNDFYVQVTLVYGLCYMKTWPL